MRLLLFFFFATASAQITGQTVRGVVTDQDTKQPLAGVSVWVAGSSPTKAVLTEKDGSFRFEQVPLGRVSLHFNLLGYEKVVLPNVIVNSGKEAVIQLNMQEAVTRLQGIVITQDKNKGQALNEMAQVSARSVSPEQTNRYAGGFNDPSRILSNFAGVTSTQDGSNDIIVRGNSPKYIQWRLEGMQITNPNHFSDQSAVGGSISALNNNLLATSDFYTGAFPAEYGDVLSGVYDVKLRQGNNEKFEALFGLGVLGTELTLEGPLKKGYKGSFLFNYRYSTVALLNDIKLVDNLNGTLNFQDATFKLVLPSAKAGLFSLYGLGGRSHFLFEDVTPALWQTPGNRYLPNKTGEDFKKASHLGNFGLTHILPFGNKGFLLSGMSFSLEGIDDDVFEKFKTDRRLNFSGTVIKSTFRGEISFHRKFSPRVSAQVGSKYAVMHYDFKQSRLRDTTLVRSTLVNFRGDVPTLRNFISLKYRLHENLSAVLGVQNMNVMLNHKSTLEPRFSVNWELSPSSIFSAGYGLHSTMESIHHYFTQVKLADGSIVEPNKDLDLLKAHHFVLGFEKRLSKTLLFKLETYYQKLYDLPVANSLDNSFATVNEGLDFQYLALVNKGSGRNYGVELTLERFFSKNYYFLINASLYNSTYKALDGKVRNTRFNGNFLLNALFGKDFTNLGKFRNKTVSLNSRAFFGGGKKIIPLLRDAEGNVVGGEGMYDYSQAYKRDLQDIYQLTFSVSYKINKAKATHELFLNVENFTNSRAKLMEYYDPKEPGKVGYMKQGSIFPNLMYRVYF